MTVRSKSDGKDIYFKDNSWFYTDTDELHEVECICQQCHTPYHIDIVLPDDIWEIVKPEGKPEGAGLLCGICIMRKLESLGYNGSFRSENIDIFKG